MILRKDNIHIYDDTETAKLYLAKKPGPIIVADTSASGYAEIYPLQKERIRSSIVYPILSDENVVLGTLVVHCDKPGFFTENKQKFWSDVLEIFVKRISVEKMKLDYLHVLAEQRQVTMDLERVDSF